MDKSNKEDYPSRIQLIEKRDLDEIELNGININRIAPFLESSKPIINNGLLIFEFGQSSQNKYKGFKFFRILGTAETINKEKVYSERYIMEDLIIGLHSQKIPFIYLIEGRPNEICLYMGVYGTANEIDQITKKLSSEISNLETSLKSTYPNIDLKEIETENGLNSLINFIKSSEHYGIMSGVPTLKIGTEEFGVQQIERVIRGLYGKHWGYIVISDPIEDIEIIKAFNGFIEEIKRRSPDIKKTETRASAGLSRTLETVDSSAQYYIEILNIELERLKIGKIKGMWKKSVYFFSSELDTFNKIKMLLKSAYIGESSFPEPIRTFRFPKDTRVNQSIASFQQIDITKKIQDFSQLNSQTNQILAAQKTQSKSVSQFISEYYFTTLVTSAELAILTRLPKEEMPGFELKKSARYGVSIPQDLKSGNVQIGKIVDRGENTGNELFIDDRLLTKHGLIIGITGSGKTNSCFHLLTQIWNNVKIPFLVIEPTKGEYRNLIELIPELRVFTLGIETVAPFRMNPFEVPKDVNVQTHLDNLKAIFKASFTMYPPMPYVLEHCLINIYEKNGWNLSYNRQGKNPTLDDLYNEIEFVVKGLGYDKEVSMNVRAALRTRIRSLLLGGKGKMLNCENSIPIEEILRYPTILELKGIGDDEEKAFLMGILFGKIYEYREAHGNVDVLQHVTLLEEAHRLLSNVLKGSEEGNQSKAKAVETLCNILTEVRAYGEGILVVDQVPSKLAPDAIKNTNIKIIHRIIAGDDRELISESIGLSEIQKQYLINLQVGHAVVFMEKLDESVLLKIPNIKDKVAGQLVQKSNENIKKYMKQYYEAHPDILERNKGPFIGCEYCGNICEFRFMIEPLINEKKLLTATSEVLKEKNGDLMMEKFISLIYPAVSSLGYTEVNSDDMPSKTLCTFIQVLNSIPPSGNETKYIENIQVLSKVFKERCFLK